MDAVILYSSNGAKGIVKQATNLSKVTFNHRSGFVTTFVFGGDKYTHSMTLNGINGNAGALNLGYYKETEVLNFWSKPGTNQPQASDLSQIADAVKHDMVKVSQLRVVAPYDEFCKLNIYSWDYDPTQDVLDAANNIIVRSTTPNKVDVPLAPGTPYSFYNKNISLITSSDFQDNRDDAAYSLALIACQISNIQKDIFPLFSQSTELSSYITAQNNEWATGNIFNQPTYEDILQYEESLTNFYNAAYSNQLLIYDAPSDTKLYWLANVLTASGLGVLPIDLKLKLLDSIVKILMTLPRKGAAFDPRVALISDSPQMILNIVDSVTVTPTQADYFLDQLLAMRYSGGLTDISLFEIIYISLSDNRSGHLTHNLINSNDNRKQYIQSLYNIWQISKYNPYYNSPNYTQSANPTGVYPESFFIANKSAYYNKKTSPGTLVSESTDVQNVINFTRDFKFELKDNKVTAIRTIELAPKGVQQIPVTTGPQYTYHLYQHVSLIGHTQDPLIIIPNTNCIPLFFLYYAYDARQTANFDFGILLSVEMVLNFTVLGGLGVAGELGQVTEVSYLGEISGAAEASTLPVNTPILSWDNLLGISKIVQFTAGSFSAISNFMLSESTNTDPQVKTFIQKLDIFLGLLNLAAVSVDFLSQISVINAARDAAADADALVGTVNFPQAARDEMEVLVNIDDLVTSMNNKLDAIQITGTNTIKPRFAALSSQDKLAFYEDFHLLDDADAQWDKLNTEYETGRTLVDDWEEFQYRLDYRNDVEVLNAYRFIRVRQTDDIIDHIIKGKIYSNGKVTGIHSKLATQYGGRIDSIITQPNSVDDVYDAFVSKADANGVFKPKLGGSVPKRNDMFPDSWDTPQRFIEELSFAFTRKTFNTDTRNAWTCTMSNGKNCILCLSGTTATFDNTTKIVTAWPIK